MNSLPCRGGRAQPMCTDVAWDVGAAAYVDAAHVDQRLMIIAMVLNGCCGGLQSN